MNHNNKIGAVLLGAGFSRRFGADKRIQPFGETTVAAATARLYANCFDWVRAVIREDDATLQANLEPHIDEFVYSKDAALGMGHSLATGFTHLDLDYAFLGFLDMPYIRLETLSELKAIASYQGCTQIVRPVNNSPNAPGYGHPLGMPKQLFDELARCSGDVGARYVLRAHADLVVDHLTQDDGIWQDVDRPEDLPTNVQ